MAAKTSSSKTKQAVSESGREQPRHAGATSQRLWASRMDQLQPSLDTHLSPWKHRPSSPAAEYPRARHSSTAFQQCVSYSQA